MMKNVLVAVAALSFAACGPGGRGAKLGGGKNGAAQALAQATAPLGTGSTGSGLIAGALPSQTQEVKGKHGGTAKLTAAVSASAAGASTAVTVEYKDFSQDGLSRF